MTNEQGKKHERMKNGEQILHSLTKHWPAAANDESSTLLHALSVLQQPFKLEARLAFMHAYSPSQLLTTNGMFAFEHAA